MRKGGPRILHLDTAQVRNVQAGITPPEAVEAHVSESLKPLNNYTDRSQVWKLDDGYWRQPNSTRFAARPLSDRIRKTIISRE